MQSKPPKVTKETRPPVRRRRWVRVVKWCALLGLLGIVLMVGTVAIVFWMYGRDPNLPSSDELRAFLRTRIAAYKVPRTIHVALDLPRTASGKIDKRALSALALVPAEEESSQ